MLQLYLFGQPRLVYDDTLVPFNAPVKTQALLVYLLLHRDQPIARQSVAYNLWPDLTESEARAHLRRHLHALGRALPSTNKVRPWVLADTHTLGWNPAADYWLDLAAFEEYAANPARRAQVLSLYTADLAENLDEEWLLYERERCRELYLDCLDQLVTQFETAREYRQAISVAQRLLRHDPLREETYCRLMRLQALSGDRSGIVRAYNTCRTVLERELHIEPAEETRVLYSRLLQFEPAATPTVPSPTGDSPRHNLPLYLDRFVGRERELRELERALAPKRAGRRSTHAEARLLTLTGLSGAGKTRLAAAVAANLGAQFSDGAWWVDLAPLGEGWQIPQSVASVLGLYDQASPQLADALVRHLQAKKLLLVLDNCEHLVPAVARLAEELLRGGPGLHILATSSEPLGLAGEMLYVVQPLPLPTTDESRPPTESVERHLAQYDSVGLFVERATYALPTFHLDAQNAPVVARICRALDGIPLALELAAARLKVLTVEQLAARLDDRFTLLAGASRTALPRHQTLRATMDWSYSLLSENERAFFQRLAVFPGGFTLEAVETVCVGGAIQASQVLNLLSQLVDKSLVVVAEHPHGGAARYRQLETVRQYARDRLTDSGEMEQLRRAHLAYFVRMVIEAEPHLLKSAEQRQWLDRLELEYDNLRAALRWAHTLEDVSSLAQLAGGLWGFWWLRGFVNEGRRWLDTALAARDRVPPALYGKCLEGAGRLAVLRGDHAQARVWLEEQVAQQRTLGDAEGVATGLNSLAIALFNLGEYAQAEPLWLESRAHYESCGNLWGVARVMNNLGDLAIYRGNYGQALAHFSKSLVLFRELNETFGTSIVLLNLGRAALLDGDPARAADFFSESLHMKRNLADKEGMAWTLEGLAGVAGAQAVPVRAAQLFGAAEALREAIGVPVPPTDRVFYEANVARAAAQLDKTGWNQAWALGRGLVLEQALQLALNSGATLQNGTERPA